MIHIEESLVEGTRAIGVELKEQSTRAAPNPSIAASASSPSNQRVLLDNERVRIVEKHSALVDH
jgi:hypothetical protein